MTAMGDAVAHIEVGGVEIDVGELDVVHQLPLARPPRSEPLSAILICRNRLVAIRECSQVVGHVGDCEGDEAAFGCVDQALAYQAVALRRGA